MLVVYLLTAGDPNKLRSEAAEKSDDLDAEDLWSVGTHEDWVMMEMCWRGLDKGVTEKK